MELGNTSSIKWFDGMGEYVIDWGPGYRIYLAKDGETLIVLFGGGINRSQHRDIDQARGPAGRVQGAQESQRCKRLARAVERGESNGTDA